MFEKSETERLETLATEAVEDSSSSQVDRPIIEEKIIGENTNLPADDDSSKYYLKELSKY